MKDRIVQNLKVIKIMKSTGYTDKEIADYLNVSIKVLLDTIENDVYLKEVWEQAQEKLASEIEKKFLENVLMQLDEGDNTDAKWLLERTHKKYNKKDTIEVNVKSIDDIIRGE
jgi:orotate phosphoribosyltransferase-like protein